VEKKIFLQKSLDGWKMLKRINNYEQKMMEMEYSILTLTAREIFLKIPKSFVENFEHAIPQKNSKNSQKFCGKL
jgi:hypothetical protein